MNVLIYRSPLTLIAFPLFFYSCELLYPPNTSLKELTTEEIVEGLKTALYVGTDSSTTLLSALNGYLLDETVKIYLPPEAQTIVDNVGLIPGGTNLYNNVILSINRAAEDAAKEVGPIFKQSISDLSITDGLAILNGSNPASAKKSSDFDSTAATQYLNSTTRPALTNLYAPKINASLDKDIVGLGYSAKDAWNDLSSAYNAVAPFMGWNTVSTDIGVHCTNKALDGLFLKVGITERKIRRNPFQWLTASVGNILVEVFGGILD